MSLVNDMLADLDERRVSGAGNRSRLEFLSAERNSNKKSMLPYLLGGGALLLFIGVWQFYSVTVSLESAVVDKPTGKSIILTPAQPLVDGVNDNNEQVSTAVTSVVIPVVSSNPPEEGGSKINRKEAVDEMLNGEQLRKEVTPVQKNKVNRKKITPSTQKLIKTILPPSPERIDEAVALKARKLISQGESRLAEQQLREQLLVNSVSIDSGKLLVTLLIAQQRLGEAQMLISDLQDQYPSSIELAMLQARSYLLSGEANKAVEAQRALKPNLSEYPSYYGLLALASQQAKQYELSGRVYKGLLDFDDSRGDWWVGLAISHDMQNHYFVAKRAYRQALLKKDTSQSLREYAQKRVADLAGL